MKKEYIEAIKFNLCSNVIWELFLSFLTALYMANDWLEYLFNTLNKYNINSTVAFVVLFFFFESLFVFLIISIKKIFSKKTTDVNPEDSTNCPEECGEGEEVVEEQVEDDFYFENYTKHVTVYQNGNGIIMNTFDICVYRIENFKEFKRKINVEDGKRDIVFPSLSKMKTTSKEKRFDEFGFWVYKSKDSIINRTVEKYWLDRDPDEIDHSAEHNPKELRWVFAINGSKVKNQKTHKISYAISVPGLYPIEKGKFNRDIANEPESEGKALSSIHVEHYAKKITYIVSFENSINLKSEPECFISINGKKEPINDWIVEADVFYNKHIFTINRPPYGADVVVKWTFYGGNDIDEEGGEDMDKEGGD